jgi:hypothetical protein
LGYYFLRRLITQMIPPFGNGKLSVDMFIEDAPIRQITESRSFLQIVI